MSTSESVRPQKYQNHENISSWRSFINLYIQTQSISGQFCEPLYMNSKKSVTVYTDGACSNNGGENAKAGIGVFWPTNESNNFRGTFEGRQTNQRAEIRAALFAINQAKKQGYTDVTIKTDSNYLKNAVESWMPKWMEEGWSRRVINKSDFRELSDSISGVDVKFEKVPANANAAHKLAQEAAKLCRRIIR